MIKTKYKKNFFCLSIFMKFLILMKLNTNKKDKIDINEIFVEKKISKTFIKDNERRRDNIELPK